MHSPLIRPTSFGASATIAIATVGTLGTFVLARSGRVSGLSLLIIAAMAAATAWYLSARQLNGDRQETTDTIDVSEWGVRHYRDHILQCAIAWTDLEEVLGVTAHEGTADETLYLVLNGTGGSSLTLPHSVAVESGLLLGLEQHFASCDTTTFYDAALRHGTQVFILWRAERVAVHTPASHDWQIRRRDDLAS